MNIEVKLRQLKLRFDEIEVMMGDPGIISNSKKYLEITKEHSDLKDIINDYAEYQRIKQFIADNEELIELDPDLAEDAEKENELLHQKLEHLEEEIKIKLVPKDPEDSKNAIVEIRAGTGGDEAAIFAGDLLQMYRRVADEMNWKFELLGLNEGTKGGFKEVVFKLEGNDVFGMIKYESGVHRVQRVPETETQGRVHTSAATVAVLPEAEEVDVQINPADLEVDTFRATGAGGQHINKTDSAIRIKHIPTGVVVECQEERSQHKNRDKAMTMLRTRLYEAEYEKKVAERAAQRKSQVSTGDRSAKIRTYNYPQGRLTDHRIGMTLYNLEEQMKGGVIEMIKSLRLADNLERLQALAEK